MVFLVSIPPSVISLVSRQATSNHADGHTSIVMTNDVIVCLFVCCIVGPMGSLLSGREQRRNTMPCTRQLQLASNKHCQPHE